MPIVKFWAEQWTRQSMIIHSQDLICFFKEYWSEKRHLCKSEEDEKRRKTEPAAARHRDNSDSGKSNDHRSRQKLLSSIKPGWHLSKSPKETLFILSLSLFCLWFEIGLFSCPSSSLPTWDQFISSSFIIQSDRHIWSGQITSNFLMVNMVEMVSRACWREVKIPNQYSRVI